jgi:hypothetical protein
MLGGLVEAVPVPGHVSNHSRLSVHVTACLPSDGRNLGLLTLSIYLTKHAFQGQMESASFACQDRDGSMAPFSFSTLLGYLSARRKLRNERMLPCPGDGVTHSFTRSEETPHHKRGPICAHASTGVTLNDLLLSLERERRANVGPPFLANRIGNMMMHLENLGHKSCHQVPEKLTVSLLEHQRQNLQWMLEQEEVPGMCCHLWAEVCQAPSLSNGTPRRDRLWYSPVFDSFIDSDTVSEAPYRGGFLCDGMGLGKSATTLALCLLHPAPEIPHPPQVRGTVSLPPLPPEALKKWGNTKRVKVFTGLPAPRVRSRGTLVVCPASLVDQWMEEAKRLCGHTLSICPYHGNPSISDPYLLSRFDIVVTSYGKVKSDPDSVPAPLTQIDFWRVVLDESHSIRNQATSTSVLGLVSNRRWLVTGTPFNNTSLYDMVGQLEFVGITNKDGTLDGTSSRIVGFVALMRRILMRHSHGQKVDGARDLVVLPPLTTHKAGVPFTDLDRNACTNLSAKSQAKYRAIRHDARHAKGSHIQHHAQRMMAELSNLRQARSGGQLVGCHKAQPPQAAAGCGACLGVLGEHPVELSPCKHAMCGPRWRARTEDDAESAPSMMKCTVCEAAVDSTALYAGTDVIPPVAVDPSQHGVVMHSKLLAVVRHLKHIRSKDPSGKSLTFSQYATAIEFLKNELPKHEQRAASASVGAQSEAAPLRQPGNQKHNPAKEVRIEDFNFLFGIGERT